MKQRRRKRYQAQKDYDYWAKRGKVDNQPLNYLYVDIYREAYTQLKLGFSVKVSHIKPISEGGLHIPSNLTIITTGRIPPGDKPLKHLKGVDRNKPRYDKTR